MKQLVILFLFWGLFFNNPINAQKAYFDSVATEVEFMTDDSARLMSLFDLTKELDIEGEPERVKEYGKQAIMLANSFEDIDKYVRMNYFVGKAYNDTRQPKIALDYFNKAHDRITDTIAARPILRNIFKQSGLAKLQLSKFKAARQDFNRALPIFEQIRDRVNIAFLEFHIGETYLGEGNYDLANVFFKQSERSYDKLKKYLPNVIECITKTGMTYLAAKNSNLALNQFNKAISRAERAKNEKAIGIAKRYMAYFYIEKEFYDEGRKWQEEGLQHFINVKDTLEIGKMSSELGLTLMELDELQKGFEKEIEALQLFAALENDEYQAVSKNNLAKHYIKIIGENEAIKHLEEAIEINQELNKTLSVADNQLNLGYVYYQNRKYNDVLKYGNASLASALEVQHLESMKKAALLLYRTYKETGDLKKAIPIGDYFDSLYQVQNELKLKQMTEQIIGTNNKIQKQVEQVQSGNLFKTLFWSLLGLIGLTIVGFFLFKNRIFKKVSTSSPPSSSPILTQEEIAPPKPEQIQVQPPVVSPIPPPLTETKIIQTPMDWTKPLELVTSIISLQSLTQQDDLSVIEYQMEQARLKSIQIIKDKIKADSNIEHFDFKTYIQEVIDFLNAIHRNQTTIINYQIKTNQQTDIFQTATLGLIATELVSNGILHAFDKQMKGNIKVELSKRTNNWMLKVSNNGNDTTQSISKKQGLGLKIVHLLAQQLGGKLEMERKKDWTEFRVGFKH